MSESVAINRATGEILVLSQGGEWEPARRARNPQSGAELFFNGREWAPVPAAPKRGTSPGRAFGLGVRDVAEGLMAVPNMLLEFPQALVNAAAGALGLPTDPTYSQRTAAALDAVGLPRPETPTEQRVSAVSRNVAGNLPMMAGGAALQGARQAPALAEMLVGNMPAQVAGAAGAGLAGQYAAESGAGAVGQLAAGLAGGVAGAGGVQALQGAGRTAAALVQPFSERGRQNMVADVLLRSSADPVGLPGRIERSMSDPTRRLSGSPVTTGVAAGDPGVMLLESGMRSQVTPNSATGMSPAVALRDIEARRNANRLAALTRMQDGREPAARGASARGALFAEEGQRRAAVSAAYEAVDPDGTAVLPFAPVREALDDALARYYGDMSGGPPAELQRVADVVGSAGETVPWRSAQNLRSWLSALEDRAEQTNDARLGAAARSVRASLDTAAARAAGEWVPAGRAVTLEDLDALAAQEGAVARPDVAAALQSVRQTMPRGEKSLVQWLVENGGVRPDGDTRQMLGGTARTRPGLLNNQAQSLDRVAERAREAGYFPELPNNANQVDNLTPRDLLDAIDAELRGMRVRYPGGGAQREANAVFGAAEREVDRALALQGLSLTDDPQRVLGAMGPAPSVSAGAGAPERVFRVENALTPEQAARWTAAQQMRRDLAQDFGRNASGTSGVQMALRGGPAAPVLPDGSVPGVLMSSPQSVLQALAAAGGQANVVRQQLRGQFIDNLFRATAATSDVADAAGNVSRALSPAGFRRFFEQNEPVARVLFDSSQIGVLRRLAADFAETGMASRTTAAAGSNTAQNLSVANLIARASNGLLDPGMPLAQTLGSAGGLLRLIYAAPEAATREMLTRAMTDPQFAHFLLVRATPANVARAVRYIEANMMDRLTQAAANAAAGAAIRTGTAEATRPGQPSAAP